jgi:hypothetical protein
MTTWHVPKFSYADHVKIVPLELVSARVVNLHFFGEMSSIEYDVRYFHEGREFKIRVFEDELLPA